MFAKSIGKSVQPHLGSSERLLGAVMAQNAGANAAVMVSALRGPLATVKAYDRADRRHADAGEAADDAGMKVDRRMVIAVTNLRLLIFRMGGAFTPKVRELLGEAPIEEVEGIDVEPAGLSKAVTLRVRGAAIGIETARGQPAEDLPRALELARPSLGG
jgi:hypothetical protein